MWLDFIAHAAIPSARCLVVTIAKSMIAPWRFHHKQKTALPEGGRCPDSQANPTPRTRGKQLPRSVERRQVRGGPAWGVWRFGASSPDAQRRCGHGTRVKRSLERRVPGTCVAGGLNASNSRRPAAQRRRGRAADSGSIHSFLCLCPEEEDVRQKDQSRPAKQEAWDQMRVITCTAGVPAARCRPEKSSDRRDFSGRRTGQHV
jgi:hypothetical protein